MPSTAGAGTEESPEKEQRKTRDRKMPPATGAGTAEDPGPEDAVPRPEPEQRKTRGRKMPPTTGAGEPEIGQVRNSETPDSRDARSFRNPGKPENTAPAPIGDAPDKKNYQNQKKT